MSSFSGGSGNDSMSYGGVSNDTMYGNAGNDTLLSGDGDDDVYGGTGQDSLDGGGGMDWLSGAQGNDTVFGGDGADTVVGGDGRDSLNGGTGNDYVTGDGFVSDETYFSPGTGASATLRITNSADGPVDLYRFDSSGNLIFSQTVQPGQTATVSTRVGDNWTLLDSTGNYLEVFTVTSTSQSQTYGSSGLQDTLYGGTGDDTVSGMFGDDQVYGNAGNDSLHGDTGNDVVNGGDGNDRAWGDDGNDSLYGGIGADSMFGGNGNDLLSGDADNDSLNGDAGNDTIYGGSGNDSVSGGTGDDTIGGWNNEEGDDTFKGGTGNDQVIGGGGNDQVWGEDGNDTLSGGVGADTLYGGNGSDAFWITDDHQTDTIFGGESTGDFDNLAFANYLGTDGVTVTYTGNEAGTYDYNGTGDATGSFSQIEGISGTNYSDTVNAAATTSSNQIYGNGGADLLTGGSAADTIDGGDGNDTLNGGAGNDSVYGGSGEDSVDGGDGNDQLEGRAGNDTIYGGLGDDVIDDEAGGGNGTGNDLSFGGAGNDTIYSGDAHDTAYGGVGNDLLGGESGNDTLTGGDGNDTLTGGSGNDTFVLEVAGDGDVITDFSLADFNSDRIYDDQLDVSGLTNGAGGPVKTWDVAVTNDGFGNAKLTFPEGETLILQGIAPSQMGTAQLRAAGIPCFASGTMIATPRGEVAVETLRPGDLVSTLDDGPQPVVWAAARHLDEADLARAPHLRPVRLTKAFTGTGRDLLVSPQHAMLVRHPDLPGNEALVRAAHLARLGGRQARIATGRRTITYVHLMFARHQIVFANACPSESFYPGPWGLAMLDSAAQAAIARRFPTLARDGAARVFGPTARPVLSMADLCRLAGAGSQRGIIAASRPLRRPLLQTA